MSDRPAVFPRRVLEPVDRVSEVLFGLIMVLTFTGSLSVAEAGRDDVRAMLVGALGCNLAWGIIDAILFLMGSLADKGRALSTLRAVRQATDPEKGRQVVSGALPAVVADLMDPEHLESLRVRLTRLPDPPARARLGRADWLGAAGVFLLVFLATFPVAIPFLVMRNVLPAMRVSNAIAVALLFLTGYAFARLTGHSSVLVGLSMVVLGLTLVGLTIALGG